MSDFLQAQPKFAALRTIATGETTNRTHAQILILVLTASPSTRFYLKFTKIAVTQVQDHPVDQHQHGSGGSFSSFNPAGMPHTYTMPMHSPEFNAAHYAARYQEARRAGDHQLISDAAGDCVRSYEAMGDEEKTCTFLHIQGSSQLLSSDYSAALLTAQMLIARDYVRKDPVLKAKTEILMAASLRNLGQHEAAIAHARQALGTLGPVAGASRIRAEAYQGLIASLVEAGSIAEAWELRDQLSESLAGTPDPEFSGHGYWTLGNLAFAHGQLDAGLEYHERAASSLKLVNNIHLWARFNKSSADVQLQAGIAKNQTQDCIDRAELAYAIVGGTPVDLAGLSLTKARWLIATDQLEQACRMLQDHVLGNNEADIQDTSLALELLAQVRCRQKT
ncbi:MAG: hypothetical protein Q4P23_16100 [Micrococcaceae bacterium]|nr:hypothetical protein [Micrococcaceae bacterium]